MRSARQVAAPPADVGFTDQRIQPEHGIWHNVGLAWVNMLTLVSSGYVPDLPDSPRESPHVVPGRLHIKS